ncbi:hypothetical protein [Agromyces sp. C10]|uniref:hypothetical protein n=1 Tax=Agromyces sp. C10 TaxID=2935077 RepID=UPI00200A5060|nr:hypothetical protein [Agromyces sp. C10]MCK8608879.1 hypothetical protein [Agromyces sp. C10]
MNDQQNDPERAGVIDSLRALAREAQPPTGEGGVIEASRAGARDDHADWRADAAKTVGQLVAEGVDRKEAARRIRWARRTARRHAQMDALLEGLDARRAERKTSAGRTSPLVTGA